jgi:uncharacterized paraquat-inducible protein A
MLSILIMVLLIVVAGWLDSRPNWEQADRHGQETGQL